MINLHGLVALRLISRLPNDDVRSLAERCDTLDEALEIMGRLPMDLADLASQQMERCHAQNIQIVPWHDDTYPDRLRQTASPPALLFVRGTLPEAKRAAVAVVGTRSCTHHYGRTVTESLVTTWTDRQAVITSGLANGIDMVAHETAVRRRGTTVAVIASGIDRITPLAAQRLADAIVEAHGCIISEHPCGVAALPPAFPARNRIISGISDAVVVIESKARGGALITAEFARQQGRPVYAVPGPITSTRSDGCNALIAKSGARVLLSADDLVEVATPQKQLRLEQRAIVDGLDGGTPRHLDELAMHWGCSASQAMQRLLDLELDGCISRLPGNHFVLRTT